ncbi:Protein HIRA [Nymphon striatum]|nr:Protein HIRA [Nymphon striatum]
MRLLKPSWVTHDGHPIFSMDIHPDGSRFVTGGQGADTGRVVIWNMAPIINEEDEANDSIPKMLCQMDNHLACVNCVRWSSSGKFLASGGDDKIVMIWQIGRYGSSTMFGSGGTVVNVEHWRCVNTLRGHQGDVLDIAWSPHDAWLASCSVDNTIVIWNALKFPEMITVLHGHTGLVKGVTWDPVGKYIASQSDDKTLRIWRTLDWKQESIVTKPFEECGGTTHVLRLSWSPDGQFLVSAHAMNNSGPTARIIERDGWQTKKDFVGHRKAVTCVSHYFCCCAVGSRDRSLSVWLTSLTRPLVVIHDLFSNSVLDISWSKTGEMLMACSWDGTIAYIDFEDNEIGTPLTDDEKNSFHHKLYGKSLAMTSQTSSTSTVIENPAMLKLKASVTKIEEIETVKPESQIESIPETKPLNTAKGPNKQIETRTADGKRRITPCFIAPAPDPGGAPLPFASNCQPTFSSSKETKSKILIEKIEEPSCSLSSTLSKESNSNGESNKQIVVNGFSSKPQSFVNGALSPKEKIKVSEKDNPTLVENNEKLKDKAPTTPISTPVSTIAVKRKAESSTTAKLIEKRKGRPPLSATPVPSTTPQNNNVKSDRTTTASSSLSLHLPLLKIEKSTTIQLPSSDNQRIITLELENNIPAASGVRLHKLQCFGNAKDASSKRDEDSSLWTTVFSSSGSAVAGSSHICCVACEDCTLSVFSSQNGHRLLPPIILSSAISRLTCRKYFVMAITSKGCVSVWDLKNVKCLVKNETLASILPNSASITNTGLTELGLPTISVSSGKSYIFHSNLSAWIQVSNTQDAISSCSNHHKLMPENMSVSSQPLSILQHKQLTKSGKNANRIFSSDPELQQNMTLSHLDSQLAAAHSLNSSKEYKFWLLTLVRFLVQECMEDRLRLICNDLIGPVCITSKSSWDSTILGLKKREILKEVLLIIGSNLKLQRLFTEYHDQLEEIKS